MSSSADASSLLPRVAEREATIGGRACFCAALAFADRLVLVASQRATFGALVAAQASSMPGGPRGAYDVRTLLGRPRRGGEEDGEEGGGNLQTLVARRLVERLARAADADGGASAADRPLLLGIALGPGAEDSLAAAREVADVLAELLAEVGVAVAPERSAVAAAADSDAGASVAADAGTSAPAAGGSSSLLVAMPEALRAQVRAAMPLHKDFPRAGIVFVDVLPLWRAPALLAPTLAALADAIAARFGPRLDFLAGLEARGFLFQSVALALKLPFVCVRKAGKLPGETVSLSYSLEYGEAKLEVSRDAVARGARGVVLDDLLATGGSAAAAAALLASLGAVVIGAAVLVDINIGGAERIGLPVLAVVRT
jgi:adenine phosphoribosyltransferase